MATQNFNIPTRQIGPAGVTSPGVDIPAGLDSLLLTVVSPDWFTTTGTVLLRFEVFKNSAWQECGSTTMTMGGTAKDGISMPNYRVGGSTFNGASQVRLFVSCSTSISIGASVTVTTV